MDEQFELFETQDDWVRRLWRSVPVPVRQEVIDLLAQMGQAALHARRVKVNPQRKETADES